MSDTASRNPAKIGRFLIKGEIARGGFAQVLRARDADLCRDVAVKVFDPHPDRLSSGKPEDSALWREAFVTEARLLDGLNAPGIVRMLEFGFEAETDRPFFVMPLLPDTLRARIGADAVDRTHAAQLPEAERPQTLTPGATKALLLALLDALSALHGAGIVHRDVKPSNILLHTGPDGPEPVLADLGIAALIGAGGHIEEPWVGSWDYAAPEHKDGNVELDGRADLFSVGILAYRLLTGRLPEGAAAPPADLLPGLNPAFDAWVLKALSTDKRQRSPDAATMRAELDAVPSAVGDAA